MTECRHRTIEDWPTTGDVLHTDEGCNSGGGMTWRCVLTKQDCLGGCIAILWVWESPATGHRQATFERMHNPDNITCEHPEDAQDDHASPQEAWSNCHYA